VGEQFRGLELDARLSPAPAKKIGLEFGVRSLEFVRLAVCYCGADVVCRTDAGARPAVEGRMLYKPRDSTVRWVLTTPRTRPIRRRGKTRETAALPLHGFEFWVLSFGFWVLGFGF